VTGLALRYLCAVFCLGLIWPVQAEDWREDIAIMDRLEAPPKVAVLRGVDKITARVTDIEAVVDQPVEFGTLTLTARTCNKRPPIEPPETTVFLEIDDTPPTGETKRVFTGWMFASSPALNALEHPVYDVWVIDCRTSAPEG
jgi:hypothetical protein